MERLRSRHFQISCMLSLRALEDRCTTGTRRQARITQSAKVLSSKKLLAEEFLIRHRTGEDKKKKKKKETNCQLSQQKI